MLPQSRLGFPGGWHDWQIGRWTRDGHARSCGGKKREGDGMIGKSAEQPSQVTLSEARDVLQKRSEEGDFGYEQQTCLDYCKKFAKLEAHKAKKLVEKLMEGKKMKLEVACKIADVLPAHRSQLVIICQKEHVELSEAEMGEVLELVKTYK